MNLFRNVCSSAAGRLAINRSVRKRNIVTLPELSYGLEDLEPVICRDIMHLHYAKHHAAYVNNYNAAFSKLNCAVKNRNPSEIVALGKALRFNGGGHINHSIFWQNLSPDGGCPSEELCQLIDLSIGGMDELKKQMIEAAGTVQGSGWVWLVFDPITLCCRITTTANQDPVEATQGKIPLLGIDVWEHAYYLQYKNDRAAYVKHIFDIVNWHDLNHRYSVAYHSSV